MAKRHDEFYGEDEARHRTEAALRAAFGAPHKPQSEMKLGKPRGKSATSPKPKKKAPPKRG
jgi:hypothetical protein